MQQQELCEAMVDALIDNAGLKRRTGINVSAEAHVIEQMCFEVIRRLPAALSGQRKMRKYVVAQIEKELGVY